MKVRFLILGVWFTYFVGTAIFLNTGYVVKQVNSWQDGEIRYGLAVSFLPARVTVFGFEIRHQDRNVQWVAQVKRLSAWISVPSLFNQEFSVSGVDGSVVKFQFRMRQKKVSSDREGFRPVFPGLAMKPVKSSTPSKPWKIHIQGIHLKDLNDIWLEEYKFKGHAEVKGEFRISPHEEVSVGPAFLMVDNGTVKAADLFVAELRKNRFRVELTPFHPDQYDGTALEFVNIEGGLETENMQLDVLNLYLRKIPWFTIQKGEGRLNAQVKISKGSFAEGTKLSVITNEVVLGVFDNAIKGGAKIDWVIGPESKTSQTVSLFDVSLEAFRLEDPRGRDQASGKGITAKFKTKDLKLTQFHEKVVALLLVDTTQVHNLRFVDEYLPPYADVKIKSGKAKIKGALNLGYEHASDSGDLEVSGEGVGVQYKGLLFTGNVNANLRLSEGKLSDRSFKIDGTTAEIKHLWGTPETKDVLVRDWSTNLKVESGRLTVQKPVFFGGEVTASMSGLTPFLAIYADGKELPLYLKALVDEKQVKVNSRLELSKKETRIKELSVRTDKVKLTARSHFTEDDSSTVALAEIGPIAVGIKKNQFENRIILNDAIGWFKAQK